MSKKIKQRQYKTKGDFARDLGLIWDNCLKYNVGKVRLLCFVLCWVAGGVVVDALDAWSC